MQKYIVNSWRENNLEKFNKTQEFNKQILHRNTQSDNLSDLSEHDIEERDPTEQQSVPNRTSLLNVQFKDQNPFEDAVTSPKNSDIKNKVAKFSNHNYKSNKVEKKNYITRNPKYAFIHSRANFVRSKDTNIHNAKYKTIISSSCSKSEYLFSLK